MATNFDIPQFGTGASPGINASRMQAIWTFLKALASGGSGSVVNADAVGGVALSGLAQQTSGTWTPDLRFGGNNVGMSHEGVTAGAYTRIGDRVLFQLRVRLSSKGSSTGIATISLPITPATAVWGSAYIGYLSNISYTGFPSCWVNISAGSLSLAQTDEAGSISGITNANFTNSSDIMIAGQYQV